jgi:hypothetical protein
MSSDKIQNTQNQVDNVVSVMRDNISKVIERGEKIDELEARSEKLNVNSLQFNRNASILKKLLCLKQTKQFLFILICFLIIVGIVIGSICLAGNC